MCKYIRDPLTVTDQLIDMSDRICSTVLKSSQEKDVFKISVPNGITVGTFDCTT